MKGCYAGRVRAGGALAWWPWVALLVVLLVTGTGAPANAAESLRIGLPIPLSGVFSDSGGRMVKGFEMAREEINTAGGIAGRPIEYVIRDDEGKVNVGSAELRKLVLSDKVQVMMGFFSSGMTLANLDYLASNNILTLITVAGTPKITDRIKADPKKYRHIFAVRQHAYQAANMVKPALSGAFFPVKRVYVVAEDIEFGHTLIDGILQLGVITKEQIVGSSYVSMNQKDFTAVIEDIKAKDPDIVVTAQIGGDAVPFAMQFYDAKLRMPLQAFAGILGRPPIAERMSPKSGYIIFGQTSADVPITPKTKPWYKKHQEKYGIPADGYLDVRAYDAVYMFKAAVEQVGSFDIDKVIPALEKLKWQGVGGAYHFDESHQVNWPITVVFQHGPDGKSRHVIWPKEHATGPFVRAPWWK